MPNTAIQSGLVEVAIVNATHSAETVDIVTDAALEKVVASLQTQIGEHFLPVWRTQARLRFYPRGTKPPADSWWLIVTDNSDRAGALGYHDLTGVGLPLGFAFAGSDIAKGVSWTITVSHELMEMLVDPYVNLTVNVENDQHENVLYGYEICDPCEADEFGYLIDGVLVSNFVYPAWFEPRQRTSSKFDWQGKITRPLELLPGGYIPVNLLKAGIGWTQLSANNEQSFAMRAHVGSRRERRRLAGSYWLLSTEKGQRGTRRRRE